MNPIERSKIFFPGPINNLVQKIELEGPSVAQVSFPELTKLLIESFVRGGEKEG